MLASTCRTGAVIFATVGNAMHRSVVLKSCDLQVQSSRRVPAAEDDTTGSARTVRCV